MKRHRAAWIVAMACLSFAIFAITGCGGGGGGGGGSVTGSLTITVPEFQAVAEKAVAPGDVDHIMVTLVGPNGPVGEPVRIDRTTFTHAYADLPDGEYYFQGTAYNDQGTAIGFLQLTARQISAGDEATVTVIFNGEPTEDQVLLLENTEVGGVIVELDFATFELGANHEAISADVTLAQGQELAVDATLTPQSNTASFTGLAPGTYSIECAVYVTGDQLGASTGSVDVVVNAGSVLPVDLAFYFGGLAVNYDFDRAGEVQDITLNVSGDEVTFTCTLSAALDRFMFVGLTPGQHTIQGSAYDAADNLVGTIPQFQTTISAGQTTQEDLTGKLSTNVGSLALSVNFTTLAGQDIDAESIELDVTGPEDANCTLTSVQPNHTFNLVEGDYTVSGVAYDAEDHQVGVINDLSSHVTAGAVTSEDITSSVTGTDGDLTVTAQFDAFDFSRAIMASSIEVEITGPQNLTYELTAGSPTRTDSVEPGSYTIQATVYDSEDNVVGGCDAVVRQVASGQESQVTFSDADYTAEWQYFLAARILSAIVFEQMDGTASNFERAADLFQGVIDDGLLGYESRANAGYAIARAGLIVARGEQAWADPYLPGAELSPLPAASGESPTRSLDLAYLQTAATSAEPFDDLMGQITTLASAAGVRRDGAMLDRVAILNNQQFLDTEVLPGIGEVVAHLQAAQSDTGFSMKLENPVDSQQHYIVDLGDLHLLEGGAYTAAAASAFATALDLDIGAYDSSVPMLDLSRDVDMSGKLEPDEYLPSGSFLDITNNSRMQSVKTYLDDACAAFLEGLDLTMAEGADDHDLVAWHSLSLGDELTAAKLAVKEIQRALSGPYLVTVSIYADYDDGVEWNWYWDDVPLYVDLGGWLNNPPSGELTQYAPDYQFSDGEWSPVPLSYSDPTFGGLFPQGLSDDLLYGGEAIWGGVIVVIQ